MTIKVRNLLPREIKRIKPAPREEKESFEDLTTTKFPNRHCERSEAIQG